MGDENFTLCRKFQLSLISAQNLPDLHKVPTLFKPRVYAKVSWGGDKKTERKTPVDKHGELNPIWNYSMCYIIAEKSVQSHGLRLVIKIYRKSKLGDVYIGVSHISIKKLFDSPEYGASLSLPLQKGVETIDGAVVNLSYGFDSELTSVPEASFWKKVMYNGAVIVARLTLLTMVGVDVNLCARVDPDIVDVEKINAKK